MSKILLSEFTFILHSVHSLSLSKVRVIAHTHLKEEALDRTVWRARFGRGFGPVVRRTTKWMNSPYYLPFLSMDTLVQSQSNECGIFDGHSGNGSCFCPSCSVYPVNFKCGDTHLPLESGRAGCGTKALHLTAHRSQPIGQQKNRTLITLRVFNFKFSSRCLWIILSMDNTV
jgi:hypothetical protein